jgi:hypothetical protein
MNIAVDNLRYCENIKFDVIKVIQLTFSVAARYLSPSEIVDLFAKDREKR